MLTKGRVRDEDRDWEGRGSLKHEEVGERTGRKEKDWEMDIKVVHEVGKGTRTRQELGGRY